MSIDQKCGGSSLFLGAVGTIGAYVAGLSLYPASLLVGAAVAVASFGYNLARCYKK